MCYACRLRPVQSCSLSPSSRQTHVLLKLPDSTSHRCLCTLCTKARNFRNAHFQRQFEQFLLEREVDKESDFQSLNELLLLFETHSSWLIHLSYEPEVFTFICNGMCTSSSLKLKLLTLQKSTRDWNLWLSVRMILECSTMDSRRYGSSEVD
jgi:hypothetical protein